MVHGDDFVAVGRKENLKKLRGTVESRYKLKAQTLGNGDGNAKGLRLLNKVIRLTEDSLELEAHPRHAEIVVKELGLERATSSGVPRTKRSRRQRKTTRMSRMTTWTRKKRGDIEPSQFASIILQSIERIFSSP